MESIAKSPLNYPRSPKSPKNKRSTLYSPPKIKSEILDTSSKKLNEIQVKSNKNLLKLEPLSQTKSNYTCFTRDTESTTTDISPSLKNPSQDVEKVKNLEVDEDIETENLIYSDSSLSPTKRNISTPSLGTKFSRIIIRDRPTIIIPKKEEILPQGKISPKSSKSKNDSHIGRKIVFKAFLALSACNKKPENSNSDDNNDELTPCTLRKPTKYVKTHSAKEVSSSKCKEECGDLDSPLKSQQQSDFRHLIFSENISEMVLQRHLALTLKGLIYSTRYLKGPSMEYIESKQIVLKTDADPDQKTLILDLDETLISCCSIKDKFDKLFKQQTEFGLQELAIKIRPYAKEFLKKMKNYFEVIIFTASSSSYAELVVKELDPNRSIISYILDRKYCLETKNGFFIKDLRIIKNRSLKNMIIIDNLVHSFGLQLANGIPILEWRNDQYDKELKYLENYLIELSKCDDIPAYNTQKLKLLDLLKMEDKIF